MIRLLLLAALLLVVGGAAEWSLAPGIAPEPFTIDVAAAQPSPAVAAALRPSEPGLATWTIDGSDPVRPCGRCRQMLNEAAQIGGRAPGQNLGAFLAADIHIAQDLFLLLG